MDSYHIPKIVRPIADFPPVKWAHYFLNQTPLDKASQNHKEKEIKVLKEEVQKELLIPILNDPKERLVLIDEIQRLGVAYHFEEAIEANLQQFHINENVGLCYKDDLQYVSLKFRLLRQHCYCISSEMFEKFKKEDGSFMENDVEGILSLYEACQLRLDGENFEIICEAYLQEARWLHEKIMPTYEEYIKVGLTTSTFAFLFMATLQGMGDIASKEDLEWVFQKSKVKKTTGILCRIMNDIHGHKVEQKRNHVPSAVECYMANFGVSAEDAYKEPEKKVEEEWKNVRAEMIRPTAVPMPILMGILNTCRTMYDLYKDGEDGFTRAEFMKTQIKALLIEPVI